MHIDEQILNVIDELALIIDVVSQKIIFANEHVYTAFPDSEELEQLRYQLIRECKQSDAVVSINGLLFGFKLSKDYVDMQNCIVAIGSRVRSGNLTKRINLDVTESADDLSESFHLYDKIKRIKENTALQLCGNEKTYGASNIDALTGLPNKHYFIELAEEVINTKTIEDKFAIVYFNIDKFQTFNDAYGFSVGDEFLKSVVKTIMDEIEYYIEARYSDDHFVVLTSIEGLIDKIKRIHEKVHTYQRDVIMEIKAGIYELHDDTPISKACDLAKLACDSIKYNYHEDYRFYDASLRDQLLKEKYIIDNIDKAVENRYLKVYYQPVVRVISDVICGMESLVRWDDPVKGFLSPGDFIPILEKHRLIDRVDKYVIEEVCKDFDRFKNSGMVLVPVSVNLSRLDFQLFDVSSEINRIASKYNVAKELLHFEVTESALNRNMEQLEKVIKQIKSDGYEVWLDDFGSEYSTLNTLQNFQFDVLKIDMKFFSTFQTNETARIIILSIVDMAKRLKMRTVAEGVETQEQFEFLKELGCDIAQGFYRYKPMPIDELKNMITEVERPQDRDYYNSLAGINLLSPDPVANIDEHSELFFTAPTAIVQLKKGYISFLFVNKAYMECMSSLGIKSLKEAELLINDKDSKINYRMLDLARQSRIDNTAKSVDYIYRGEHCNITIKEIASTHDTTAYFTTLINLSNMNRERKEDMLNASLPFVYSIYNRVDLLDVTNDKLLNLYLNASYYKSNISKQAISKAIEEYAVCDIHKDDQSRFIQFYDCDTIKQRISSGRKGYVTNYFRTRVSDSEYNIQFYIIIQAGNGIYDRYLSCVLDMNEDVARKFVFDFTD